MSENNPRIKFLDGSRRLVVRMLTKDDAGAYSCVLKNDAGEITRSCNLTVKGNYLKCLFCTRGSSHRGLGIHMPVRTMDSCGTSGGYEGVNTFLLSKSN